MSDPFFVAILIGQLWLATMPARTNLGNIICAVMWFGIAIYIWSAK